MIMHMTDVMIRRGHMSVLDNGVKEFIMTRAVITVGFPVGFSGATEINCFHCKFFTHSSGVCQITKEVSEFPQRYVGSHCPLEFIDEERKE